MSLDRILLFVGRAGRFALAVCAVYALVRWVYLKCRGEKISLRRELVRLLCVGYLAALAEIIALRGGPGDTRELRLIPMKTTLGTVRDGLWPFVYNFAGNIVWFVPLGMMLFRKKPVSALLTGAAVSASLEALQWLLKTGVTDIDDVIINALGALTGWLLFRAIKKQRTV